MKTTAPAVALFAFLSSACSGLIDEAEPCCRGWRQEAVVVQVEAIFEETWPGAHEAIFAAFDAWSAVAELPAFEFAIVDAAEVGNDGINTVSLQLLEPPYEDNLGATAFYADEDGYNVEGDVIINSLHADPPDSDWAVLEPGPDELPANCGGEGSTQSRLYDLQSVLTHEVGHFLGIRAESVNEDDTMFASTQFCSISKRTLEPNDVAAIQALYGAR